MKVDEVEYLRILQAFDLELCVGFGIRRDEGGRGDAEHVLRELLLFHQLRSGYAHQLDAHAHETNVVDVRRDVGAGPCETDPGAVGARLRVDSVAQLRGKVVMHDKLCADYTVGLSVAPTLEPSGLPEPSHLRVEAGDDRVNVRLFIWE